MKGKNTQPTEEQVKASEEKRKAKDEKRMKRGQFWGGVSGALFGSHLPWMVATFACPVVGFICLVLALQMKSPVLGGIGIPLMSIIPFLTALAMNKAWPQGSDETFGYIPGPNGQWIPATSREFYKYVSTIPKGTPQASPAE